MEAQNKTPLRITTWNVLNLAYENPEYYHDDAHPHLHWTKGRAERVAEYARALQSDVYALQEVSEGMSIFLCAKLNEGAPGRYAWMWERRTAPNKPEDGCAILWRTDRVALVFNAGFAYQYHTTQSHIALAKLFTAHAAGGAQFWLVNTHVNWASRAEDLALLQELMGADERFEEAPQAPRLAMGDFNAEASEAWYAQLGKNGLWDVCAQIEGGHPPFSYNSGKQAKFIDFVLAHGLPSERVGRVAMGAGEELGEITALPNAAVPSDHLPITFELFV